MELGSLPNPAHLPDLPLFNTGARGQVSPERLASKSAAFRQAPPLATPVAGQQTAVDWSGSNYDPTAALLPKLMARILNLEYVKMAELVTDVW